MPQHVPDYGKPVASLVMRLVDVDSPPGSESAMARLVAEELRQVGVRHVWIDEEFEGSPSVVAFIPGQPGPVLQWHAHLDSISTPHSPPVRDGDRIIARGANDMKGSIASMIIAAGILAQRGGALPGSVLLTFHGLHEEGASAPLVRLFERGLVGTAALSGEGGSDGDLMLGADGLAFWDAVVELEQPSTHEVRANPGGRHAVDVLALLLGELHEYAAALRESGGSLFIGAVSAGDYYNRVPTTIAIKGTRRHSDAETLDDVVEGLETMMALFAQRHNVRVQCEVERIAESYRVPGNAAIVEALADAYRDIHGTEMVRGLSPAVTNAAHFATIAQIPVVGYGPSLATSHSDEEIVAIPVLEGLVPLYVSTTERYLEADGATSGLTVERLQDILQGGVRAKRTAVRNNQWR